MELGFVSVMVVVFGLFAGLLGYLAVRLARKS